MGLVVDFGGVFNKQYVAVLAAFPNARAYAINNFFHSDLLVVQPASVLHLCSPSISELAQAHAFLADHLRVKSICCAVESAVSKVNFQSVLQAPRPSL